MQRLDVFLKRRVFRDVASAGLWGVICQGLAAAGFVLLARELPTPAFGALLAFTGGVLLVTDACDFGSSTALARSIAAGQPDECHPGKLMGLKIRLAAALLIGSTLAIGLGSVLAAATLAFSASYLANVTALAYLRGLGAFFRVGVIAAIDKAALLCALLLLVFCGRTPTTTAYLLAAAGTQALSCLLALRSWPRDFNFREWSPRALAAGRHYALSSLATNLNQLYATIVAGVAGATAAALFAAPYRLASPLLLIGSALATVALHRGASGAATSALMAPGRLLAGTSLAAIFIGLCAWWFGAALLGVVLGERYGSGTQAVLAFSLIAFLFAAVNYPLTTLLQGYGQARQVALILSVVHISSLGAVTVGASVGRATGAALSVAAVQFVVHLSLVRLLGRSAPSQIAKAR